MQFVSMADSFMIIYALCPVNIYSPGMICHGFTLTFLITTANSLSIECNPRTIANIENTSRIDFIGPQRRKPNDLIDKYRSLYKLANKVQLKSDFVMPCEALHDRVTRTIFRHLFLRVYPIRESGRFSRGIAVSKSGNCIG